MAASPSVADVSLVFDGVTVVDVETGRLIPDQRVVIGGNRIRAVGSSRAVKVSNDVQVVDARGQYLIPGLWDLHMHLATEERDRTTVAAQYQLLLATGVTGLRDPGSPGVSLDTFVRWRREIMAGQRVGPPRQIFSGVYINEPRDRSQLTNLRADWWLVADTADARHLVDSANAAGVDMLKPYTGLSPEMFFFLIREARRTGLRIGGHVGGPGTPAGDARRMSVTAASDSGISLVDHINSAGGLDSLCYLSDSTKVALGNVTVGATVERCRPIAERLRRNGTWMVPTVTNAEALSHMLPAGNTGAPAPVVPHTIPWLMLQAVGRFWTDSVLPRAWLRDSARVPTRPRPVDLRIAERAGLPLMTGTDLPVWRRWGLPGVSLHTELALLVDFGLSPLAALQAATLNPAKWLRATDSLGTVAVGKLADVVLLDANPLEDITHTTAIRAVVANGRFYDRAALDRLVAEARAQVAMWP